MSVVTDSTAGCDVTYGRIESTPRLGTAISGWSGHAVVGLGGVPGPVRSALSTPSPDTSQPEGS